MLSVVVVIYNEGYLKFRYNYKPKKKYLEQRHQKNVIITTTKQQLATTLTRRKCGVAEVVEEIQGGSEIT